MVANLKGLLHEQENSASTLVELLQYRALEQPESVAFIFLQDGETESHRLTYRELDEQARAIASRLQTFTMPGERALLLYPSGLEFIAGFFGCLYAGIVAVPAYPPRQNQSLSRLQAIVASSQATVVLTSSTVLASVEKHIRNTPDLAALQWLATDKVDPQQYDVWHKPIVSRDTLAFLQYTSGSTGNPKGVMVSHGNLLDNQQSIQTAFSHTQATKIVAWLPLFHDMGLIGNTLQPLYLGVPCIIMPPVAFLQKPIRWLKAISKYGGTTSGGPNFAYDLCVRQTTASDRAGLDLSSWTLAFDGAEPVRAETLESFAATFAECGFRQEAFYPCYGMAEATLFVSGGVRTQPPVVLDVSASALTQNQVVAASKDADTKRVVSCGKAWLDQKIKIVDPETLIECASSRIGEIWISGSNVAKGYWQQSELTESCFQAYVCDTNSEPFLRTGDLGFLQDGELFITGRLKDVLIIRGKNHYPQDIELTVENSHPALHPNSGAAFLVEVDGIEQLVVVQEVERQFLRKLDTDAIITNIRKAVALQHGLQIHDVVLLKTTRIPKTSSGKIQRQECCKLYQAGMLEAHRVGSNLPHLAVEKQTCTHDSVRPSSLEEEQTIVIETWLLQWLARKIKREPQQINPTAHFTEYGLDSLQAIELVGDLKERSGLSLSEDTIYSYSTIRKLSHYLAEQLNKAGRLFVVESNEKENSLSNSPDKPHATSFAEIPPENYQFDLLPEYLELQSRLSIYENGELDYPYFPEKARFSTSTTIINGRELLEYSHYDYLGLAGEPRVIKAAQKALEIYGTSLQATPLISGRTPLHKELEKTIAEWFGVEDCLMYASGHATNINTIGHIVGAGDLILYDRFVHNSAVQGTIMSGATSMPFPHNDWQALDDLLSIHRPNYRRTLIMTEGVFSMDGDIPDLPKFIEIKKRHKAWLIIDEAHSLGVLGKTGRGIGEYFQVSPQDVDLWMGTTSKALAGCGGYIAGCQPLIDYLKHTSPGYVFAAGMPPASAAASLEALRIIQAEPQRVAKLHQTAELFRTLARNKGLNVGASHDSPIIPILIGDYTETARLANVIRQQGINVFPIGWPVVPAALSRLRFMVSALHTEEQIKFTVNTIAELIISSNDSQSMSCVPQSSWQFPPRCKILDL
ncbi:Carrier domain-containing protein [Nostoc sp. DSM 114161]|jgi:8-amino-7-oxononanoate synthase|uniref:aminotransferase class I/II-fold pyridoxal phosphate-dependent enzyme n=1 Tax=Nostoc sp. DSM 114161 TaxID=3440143 RepID=UPI004045C4C6